MIKHLIGVMLAFAMTAGGAGANPIELHEVRGRRRPKGRLTLRFGSVAF